MIKRKETPDQIFNMDKTGFGQSQKTKKVVAVEGNKNVWTKICEAICHVTLTACVSASGFVVPPLFLVPGQHLRHEMIDACKVPASRIAVAPKDFMNSEIFIKWLEHFENSVPGNMRRPLLLVYDGYSSHYNANIIKLAKSTIREKYAAQQAKGKVTIWSIGKKGFEHFQKNRFVVDPAYKDIFLQLSFEQVQACAKAAVRAFEQKSFDRVELVYSEFRNAATQKFVVEQFLQRVEVMSLQYSRANLKIMKQRFVLVGPPLNFYEMVKQSY